MRVVGLTGSIGCGKSSVAKMMRDADVLNLDELAHELLQKGTSAAALISARFPDCVAADGSIDRMLLGPKIFASDADRRWLNSIMHWRIAVLLAKRLLWLWLIRGSSMVVLDAPLLFETGLNNICFSGAVCVTTSLEVQMARLVSRDNISLELAQQKIAAQMSSQEKAKRSTYVIDNSGTLQETAVQVDAIMEKLRSKAGVSRWVLVALMLGAILLWSKIMR